MIADIFAHAKSAAPGEWPRDFKSSIWVWAKNNSAIFNTIFPRKTTASNTG